MSVGSDDLSHLVLAARAGDVAAYGKLVRATQSMSLAVALSVLRESAGAEDAVQEAYLRAFRTLRDLEDPAAFPGWLRRVVITVALNLRRTRRITLLSLEDVHDVPVLDESEDRWSEAQRQRVATGLLTLSTEERRICDRRYHGGWSLARLAKTAFTDRIVRHLGGDPTRHTAMGVGYGLERFAMLRYGIDDIRKIDVARVA